MLVQTREFGQVEVDDRKLLRFVAPILGFGEHRRFALIENERVEPFAWLQSLTAREVAFSVVDARQLNISYEEMIGPHCREHLQAAPGSQLRALVMVIIPEDVRRMRVSLNAPILVNEALGLAAQFVIETPRDDVPEACVASSA